MKRLTALLLAALVAAPAAAPAADEDSGQRPRVRLETSRGPIVLALRPDKAPKTVANFLRYVRDGHYDGTIFHRVIPGFMIQGGGYTPDFKEKPTRAPIHNEADNGLHNGIGTVAMARTGRPHSATAQFFINVADNDFLDFRAKTPRGWGYAVFGKVVEGMDTVRAIAKTPTGSAGPFPKDVPQTPVVIQKAQVAGE
ncbi:MAG TPA: peptidylprolyl isomerase [Gammaproteobacteria bacterium]|nr:peptidylprolyl isomerase [Gammaproteobacteria bacterium]